MNATVRTSFALATSCASFALMLSLFACNTDPAKDKAKATVAEAVSVAPPTPAASGSASAVTGDVYEFSQDGSKVDFVGAKVTAKEAGSFKTFSGKIVSADGRPENANVTVEIDIASLTVPEAKLVNHLKSPDFFDAEKFPKAVFVSTSIKPGGEKGATHTVSGNLTLHGVTKSIAFPATLSLSPAAAHASAEFAINRKDFGIVYPGAPDDLVKDDVLIQLTILAKKAS